MKHWEEERAYHKSFTWLELNGTSSGTRRVNNEEGGRAVGRLHSICELSWSFAARTKKSGGEAYFNSVKGNHTISTLSRASRSLFSGLGRHFLVFLVLFVSMFVERGTLCFLSRWGSVCRSKTQQGSLPEIAFPRQRRHHQQLKSGATVSNFSKTKISEDEDIRRRGFLSHEFVNKFICTVFLWATFIGCALKGCDSSFDNTVI